MLTLVASAVLSLSASITPETIYYEAYAPVTEGQYTYTTDAWGGWRKTFIAGSSGIVTIQDIDFEQVLGNYSCRDMFTIRTHSQPYDEFTVEFRQVPEPSMLTIFVLGLIWTRRQYGYAY